MSGHRRACLIAGAALALTLIAPASPPAAVFGFEASTLDLGLGGVASMVVSPDGTTLYTSTPWDAVLGGPTVVALARGTDGRIQRIQGVFEGPPSSTGSLCGAGQIVASPDARHVYVVTRCANGIRPFLRAGGGELTALRPVSHLIGRTDVLDSPVSVAVAPDGSDVYVANDQGDVGIFRRDPASGDLVRRREIQLSPGLPSGGTTGMAMSPDGASLYVVQHAPLDREGRIVVLRRDRATGLLEEIQTKADGVDGFVSLAEVSSVTVGPDGRHVFGGDAAEPSTIVTFDRQPSGRLRAARADIRSELSSRMLAVSSDGRLVLALGNGRVTVFDRHPRDGRLTVAQTIGEDDLGDCALGAIALDPSGTDLYVAASGCGRVVHLRRTCGDGVLASGETCDDGNHVDGDGCDALCRVERCFACTGTPSTCSPDDGVPCEDGNACTEAEQCAGGVCAGGVAVADGTACDDGDACIGGDRCTAGACTAPTPVECGLCEACDRRFGCLGAIRAGCSRSPEHYPARGKLDLRLRRGDARTVSWIWGGEDFEASRLGDPTKTTGYTFCVFDASGANPALGRRAGNVVAAFRVPAGGTCGRRACWRPAGPDAFVYRSADASDGVRSVTLHPKRRRTSHLALSARNRTGRLPMDHAVTAQLANDAGACWSTSYGFPEVETPRRFFAPAGCRSCGW